MSQVNEAADDVKPIRRVTWIGINAPLRWAFGVGTIDGRWVGFATNDSQTVLLCITTDDQIGVTDRDECIARSMSVIHDRDGGFGGFTEFYENDDLWSSIDVYRCRTCDALLCKSHEREKWSDE